MNRIYPTTYYRGGLDSYSEFVQLCAAGEVEKVKICIRENVNIYQLSTAEQYYTYVAIFIAVCDKKQEIVDLLLDIYEQDLAALEGTNFNRALLALPEDRTEEFWETVELEAGDEVVPVLLKDNNSETPRCVYLRNRLLNRQDLSLKFARDLEAKNGICDLNWRISTSDSLLHLAVFHKLRSATKRLINHRTVDRNVLNGQRLSPLHYAFFVGNLEAAESLASSSDYKSSSYLYEAALSGKQSVVEFLVSKMIENGKSWNEVMEIPLSHADHTEHLIHMLAKHENFIHFLNNAAFPFSDRDFHRQNSRGETILHIVTIGGFKLNAKMKLIGRIVQRSPRILLIENNDHQLPLHYAALFDVLGQRLYKCLLQLTVRASGNSEIFYSNIEAAIATIESAIDNSRGLSANYIKHFEKLLQSHGPRLLQKTINTDKSLKQLHGILSSNVKINPNEFYSGTNGFLLVSACDIDAIFYSIPASLVYKRFKMLVDYHRIEDFNARDSSGSTLFMNVVALCEDNKFIRSCIESGADCLATNSDNLNCLHYAAKNSKNKKIVGILLDYGVSPQTIATTSKRLPIHYAMTNENCSAVKALIPHLTAEDLQAKFGNNDETLIQFAAYVENEEIFETVWNLYRSKNIIIDVNDTNLNGENLPMIALKRSNMYHLDLIFSNCIGDLNFDAKDNNGETLTHKLALHQQIMRSVNLLETYPVLKKVLNDQLNEPNNEGATPLDDLTILAQYDECVDDKYVKFFIEQLSLDNLKKCFHRLGKRFVFSSKLTERIPNILEDVESFNIFRDSLETREVFFYFLDELAATLHQVRDPKSLRNVLHLVCEKNEAWLVDLVLKSLTDEAFEVLASQVDADNMKAFDRLNDSNRVLFASCFKMH